MGTRPPHGGTPPGFNVFAGNSGGVVRSSRYPRLFTGNPSGVQVADSHLTLNLKTALGGTTDFTDYTDSEISEGRPASLHLTQWVRRVFAPSALKSVSSVKSVVPISGFRLKAGLGFLTQRRKGAEDAELRNECGPENVHLPGAPVEPRTFPHSSASSAPLRLGVFHPGGYAPGLSCPRTRVPMRALRASIPSPPCAEMGMISIFL